MQKIVIEWNDEEIPNSIVIFVCFLVCAGMIDIGFKQLEKIASIAGIDNFIFSMVMGVINGSQWLWWSFKKK